MPRPIAHKTIVFIYRISVAYDGALILTKSINTIVFKITKVRKIRVPPYPTFYCLIIDALHIVCILWTHIMVPAIGIETTRILRYFLPHSRIPLATEEISTTIASNYNIVILILSYGIISKARKISVYIPSIKPVDTQNHKPPFYIEVLITSPI